MYKPEATNEASQGKKGRPREFDRDKVIQATATVFFRQGYYASSVDDICTATGLARGRLYGIFPDKKEMLLASLDLFKKGALARLADNLKTYPGKKGIQQALLHYIRTSVSGKRGCLITNEALEMLPQDKEVAAKVEEVFREMATLLAGAVRKGQFAGDLRSGMSRQAAANFLLCVIQGLRVMGRVYKATELQQVATMAMKSIV